MQTPLFAYWVPRPYMIAVQFVLLLVAWTHACIGLYFWLRLKPFFKWAGPILLAIAVLLPPLAMIGAHHGGREVVELAKQPQWRAENLKPMPPRAARGDRRHHAVLFSDRLPRRDRTGVRGARRAHVARAPPRDDHGVLSEPAGPRAEGHERPRSQPALQNAARERLRRPRPVLDLPRSRRQRPQHACRGRPDARPSCWRASAPAPIPSIRLACQLRPQTDVAVIPVLPPNVGTDFVRNRQRVNIGEERYVVSMFVDMRGSTTLAEARLPFDIVFLINRFVEAASQAVIAAGGQPNQFVGDGVLALFGLDVDPPTACRQAMRAASLVASNVAYLNHQFATEVREPIQFGIGIHGGEVIVGDIGFRGHTVFTALGDSVNVAARLQDMTKSLDCKVIVSEDVCKTAGIALDALTRTEVAIRGRDEPMIVRTAADPTVLASLLDPQSDPDRAAVVRSRSPGVIGPAGSVWE